MQAIQHNLVMTLAYLKKVQENPVQRRPASQEGQGPGGQSKCCAANRWDENATGDIGRCICSQSVSPVLQVHRYEK